MLSPVGNHFNWSTDNFGATYTDAGFGTSLPGHASANTKGANTAVLSALAEDCYGIEIIFVGGHAAGTAHRYLVDLLIDPAGGTSWTVAIANLYAYGPSFGCGGWRYYFPLYLKAGTAIGCANQALVAGKAIRVGIQVHGKPTRPELLRVGTKVQTYGATTGTTSGTAFTPGTNAVGAWSASLGTSSYNQFWWQCGHAYDDGSIGGGAASISEATWLDVSASNDAGTTKVIVAENITANFSTTEQGGKEAFGSHGCYREVPSGANIYMRGTSSIAPNTTPTCVAYGLGG